MVLIISGISLQSIFNSTSSDRDCSRSVLVRKTDQNLVPESQDEVQKRQQVAQHQERAEEDQPRRGDHHHRAQEQGPWQHS